MDCTISFTDGPEYTLTEMTDQRKLLKVHTWKLYRFDMTSADTLISFFGTRFSGHILPANEAYVMPIIAGMFLFDEKFRRKAESD